MAIVAPCRRARRWNRRAPPTASRARSSIARRRTASCCARASGARCSASRPLERESAIPAIRTVAWCWTTDPRERARQQRAHRNSNGKRQTATANDKSNSITTEVTEDCNAMLQSSFHLCSSAPSAFCCLLLCPSAPSFRSDQIALGDHHVDTHVAVHELRDVRVRGHRCGLVGLHLGDPGLLLKELHHLADGRLRRDDE